MEQAKALQYARRLGSCFGFRATVEGLAEVTNLLLRHFEHDQIAQDAVNQFLYRHPKWPGIQVLNQFLTDYSKAETERDPVKAQLLRLAQLPTSAVDVATALEDLERWLREKGQDLDHIKRAVDHWLNISSFLPTPYELGEALRVTAVPLPAAGCALCNGTGFRRTVRTVHRPTGDEEYSAVEDCDCLKALRSRQSPAPSPEAA